MDKKSDDFRKLGEMVEKLDFTDGREPIKVPQKVKKEGGAVIEETSSDFVVPTHEKKHSYFKVYDIFALTHDLSPVEILLLARIGSFDESGNSLHMSQNELARRIGATADTVRTHLAQLEKLELIKRGHIDPKSGVIHWRLTEQARQLQAVSKKQIGKAKKLGSGS